MMSILKKIVLFPVSLFVAFLALMAKWLLTLSAMCCCRYALHLRLRSTLLRQDKFFILLVAEFICFVALGRVSVLPAITAGTVIVEPGTFQWLDCRIVEIVLIVAAIVRHFLLWEVVELAATRLIALHKNKGKSVAACLKSRTDYVQNPDKTEQGELVSCYECSPLTVDEEFMLSKRQYELATGRRQKSDIIAYQIRQSFKPGEITAEEANKVGYELAMRLPRANTPLSLPPTRTGSTSITM